MRGVADRGLWGVRFKAKLPPCFVISRGGRRTSILDVLLWCTFMDGRLFQVPCRVCSVYMCVGEGGGLECTV